MAYVRVSRATLQPAPIAVVAPGAAGGGRPEPIGAAADGGGTTTTSIVARAAPGGLVAERPYWIAGYGCIAVGFVAALVLNAVIRPSEYKAAAGFDAFAAFYIVAQSLERFFEPVTNFIKGSAGGADQVPAAGANAPLAGALAPAGVPNAPGAPIPGPSMTRPQAVAALDQALATASSSMDTTEVKAAVVAAATAKATIDQIRSNAAILVWGAQSGLAMLACGAMGLFLLRGVGAAGVPVPIDILVTGIAIGGGSKALHDLIKSVQASKENKQDPAEAGGSA